MISEMNDELIESVLQSHHIGHVGCLWQGEPYVVPVTYVYDDGYVYGHSWEGTKIQAMRQHPNVCFEVDDIEDMSEWRTIIAHGRFEELFDSEADQALELLVATLAPSATSETFLAPAADVLEYSSRGIRVPPTRGVAYRIKLERKTGRSESRA